MPVTHALEAGRRLDILLRPSANDFRLTLAPGDPTPAADQTAKTTLYLTAHLGDLIALWTGGRWHTRSSPEVLLSLASLLADTVYDIFAYWTGAAVALEALAWTSATARATTLVRLNGVWVKATDSTRRWVGTISTTVAGQTEDSRVKRFIVNAQNLYPRPLTRFETAAQWTYTTAAWRQANANAVNQVAVISPLALTPMDLRVVSAIHKSGSGAACAIVGIGEDSTTVPMAAPAYQRTAVELEAIAPIDADLRSYPIPLGRHVYTWIERALYGSGINFQGTGADTNRCGLVGTVWT
jgi:hypothetical protein